MVNLKDFLSKLNLKYTILCNTKLDKIIISSASIGIDSLCALKNIANSEDVIHTHVIILRSPDIKKLLDSSNILFPGILIIVKTALEQDQTELLNKIYVQNNIGSIFYINSDLTAHFIYIELLKYISQKPEPFQDLLVNEYMNVMELITKDTQIESLASLIYKLLNNPVIITDKAHRVLSYCEANVINDPIWKSIIEYKYCQPYILKMADFNNLRAKFSQGNLPLFVDSRDFLGYAKRAVYPISINDKTIGYITLLEDNKKISKDDLRMMKVIAKALAVRLTNDSVNFIASKTNTENYLKQLFSGNFPNEALAVIHFESFGWKISDYFCVFEAQSKVGTRFTDKSIKDFYSKIRDLLSFCTYTFNSKNAYFLIGYENDKKVIKQIHSKIEAILQDENLIIYSGNVVDTLIGISESYKQAKKTAGIVHLCKNTIQEKYIYLYNEIALYDILLDFDKIQPYQKKNRNIDILRAADKTEKTEYISTLKHFFNSNQSIGATAKAMYLHHNTVKYRINKIREIIEDDFDSSTIRLHMYISLLIDDLTGIN